MSWITESRRLYHLLYSIPFGFVFTILFVAGMAIGMEVKDVDYSNNGSNNPLNWKWGSWDWLDISATLIGGLIGQLLQILFIVLVF